jgi:activator of 2-hydroxyglutaryl-CoA dehydratase
MYTAGIDIGSITTKCDLMANVDIMFTMAGMHQLNALEFMKKHNPPHRP